MAIDLESYEHVRLTISDRGVLSATITNPARKNAVNAGITGDLRRLWRDIDDDIDIRVVVLQGEGEAFCAGADLTALANDDHRGR